jgi:hypothetical protein
MLRLLLLYLAISVPFSIAVGYRIRQNRRRYRIRRAHGSLRAWVQNRGRWHDFDE